MVHLCGRPLRNRGRCTLGRETAIQQMDWCDGRLAAHRAMAGRAARSECARLRRLPPHVFPPRQLREDFDWAGTAARFSVAAVAVARGAVQPDGAARPSAAVRPRTLGSLFRQSLVARRQQAHCYSATTVIEFEPEHFQQMAGLDLLLQQQQIPLPVRLARCGAGEASPRDVVPARPSAVRCVYRADRHSCRRAGASACGGGRGAPVFRVPCGRAGMDAGCRGTSTPASSPTRPQRRARRISRARSLACAARNGGNGQAGGFRLLRVPRAGVCGGPAVVKGLGGPPHAVCI